jgi:hypothetical protein
MDRKQSFGCFSWLLASKKSRSFEEEKENTRVVKTPPPDSVLRSSDSRNSTENRTRLSRESGRSRASSSELQKRVSFCEDANSKSSSNMSTKGTVAQKYPSRLDLLDEDLSSSQPTSSDALMKTSSLSYGSKNESNTKLAEGSAHKLVEDVVDKFASTIHSTLFPPPPQPSYVLKSKGQNDEDLYLL